MGIPRILPMRKPDPRFMSVPTFSLARDIDGKAEPSFRAGLIEKGGAVCVPVDNGQINSCTERNRQFYLESILRFLACEPLRPVRHAVCQPPQFARSFHVVSPYLSID